MHILVILTDMTSYAEALREIHPRRMKFFKKGISGISLFRSCLAYERAGMLHGGKVRLRKYPYLQCRTMICPSHTGPYRYITEGQIVLSGAYQRGIYPPISILPSLSRLMKDGREGYRGRTIPIWQPAFCRIFQCSGCALACIRYRRR